MMEFRDVMLTLVVIGQGASYLWGYMERRGDKTSERIAELNEQIEALERHVAALESAADNAPTHADLAKLYDAINTLAAIVNQMVGENRGQSDMLRLILNQVAQKGMK